MSYLKCPVNRETLLQLVSTYAPFAEPSLRFINSNGTLDFACELLCDNDKDSYKEVAQARVLHKQIVVINNDELAKVILKHPRFNEFFGQSYEFSLLTDMIDGGAPLTCMDFEEHISLRTTYKEAAFSPGNVGKIASKIAKNASIFVKNKMSIGSFNVPEALLEYTLNQSLACIVEPRNAVDVPELADCITKMEAYVSDKINMKFRSFFCHPPAEIKLFHDIASKIVKEPSDGILIKMKEEKPSVILSAAKTVLAVGSGTTRSLLTSALYILQKYPDIQERIYDCVLSNSSREDFSSNPAWKENCTDLVCFVYEVLRLYPPILALARFTKKAFETDIQVNQQPYVIPEGSTVYISVFHLQRSAEMWLDPEVFDPSRFQDKKILNGFLRLAVVKPPALENISPLKSSTLF
jgi:cytochrome P450